MIQVDGVAIRVGSFALDGASLVVPTGEYGVLMGKTGSGKTTLLEAICGLRPIRAGAIRLLGRDVAGLRPADRGVGYVPQDGALFPTMTIREHLSFGPVLRGWRRDEIDGRVSELSKWLRLERLLERKPGGLSGGEAQRVALGRALAARPSILCLDEPLSALDDETREEMYAVLETVHRQAEVTTLHVTHHRGDAQRLADRVFILREGGLKEVSPKEIEA